MSHLWTSEALVAAMDGRPLGPMPDGISGISIDSRSLQPGDAFFAIKGETMEFCYILSGIIELTEQGQPPRIFRAGDSFVMKPGFVGVWKTIETVRKIYVIAG